MKNNKVISIEHFINTKTIKSANYNKLKTDAINRSLKENRRPNYMTNFNQLLLFYLHVS